MVLYIKIYICVDYDGKKINNRMPSVHRVCTTLPVREASEIRMKRE